MSYLGGGGAAVLFLSAGGVSSGAVTSGAGEGGPGGESCVCGEFGASVFSGDGAVAAGRVTISVGVSGR
jgi:hypothetical protein